MPFSRAVRTALLVKAGRRCCLCARYCASKIEVHHIIPEPQGANDEDNGVPLCFDCHAEVGAYNDAHPRGTKLTPAELRLHRDRLFRWIAQHGPLVADILAHETYLLRREALERDDPGPPLTRIDLGHEAKVARYLRYLRDAEERQRRGEFDAAIPRFEAAFTVAESDVDLRDYARAGNYHLRKLNLWMCYLESAAAAGDRRYLQAAFNLGIDENAIAGTYQRERIAGGLQCRDYLYLLLQERLFLFDAEMRRRAPLHARLERIAQLMDLVEDPHCPGRQDDLVARMRLLEEELKTKVPQTLRGQRFVRLP
jgi:hypothetical protein